MCDEGQAKKYSPGRASRFAVPNRLATDDLHSTTSVVWMFLVCDNIAKIRWWRLRMMHMHMHMHMRMRMRML
jgi:hypothetical protein